MQKAAQISVFILLGAIVLIGATVFFLAQEQKDAPKEQIADDGSFTGRIEGIERFVSSCLESTSYEALELVGASGGFYPLIDGAAFGDETIAYHFLDGKNMSSSLGEFERSIALAVEDNIDFCIKDFRDFPGILVQAEEAHAGVSIGEGISIALDYPITAISGNERSESSQFQANIAFRTKQMYGMGLLIVEELMKDPHDICLNCILDSANEANLTVEMEPLSKTDVLFTITEQGSDERISRSILRFAISDSIQTGAVK
ncbi:MAG: hypothetical protein A2Z88_10565 [Omnitrophica WOR_2 bacterium GWA2_47_8]|nr:MAG: hypothetical protein A2Z88_10565 [Omnitrophica WOR_2 bacterium GWA2_47_8]